MPAPELPEVPAPLKSIQYYLKIASTHDQRDCVVSYWCRLYALQTGLKLSTKTTEETNFLLKLMDWLEATKKELRDNEAITNDVAAQAHLENWALKLFLYADKNDRASNFGKNVVQSFYTAGLLYDVLTIFGELSEEASQNRKYAKWKAAYIHNCIKNGETPVPGPMTNADGEVDFDKRLDEGFSDTPSADVPTTVRKSNDNDDNDNNDDDAPSNSNESSPTSMEPRNTPSSPTGGTVVGAEMPGFESCTATIKTEGGVDLSMEQMAKAQKFIKWAGSALNYDDVSTAVANLRKALHLLTTGCEPI
ncbi:hypothetical protein KM043_001564 [Ampulex compressa]|nr:hypothetical protein KM043_001564 [Ampulex compressa]